MTKQPYHRENLAAAIQQRARQELEELGVDQLSLRRLAKFLAVTPAAIYRHFPDKASLLTVLRTDILTEVEAALRTGVLDSPAPDAMLSRLITNLLGYQQDHPRAVAFGLTQPWPVPQSLTTVLTLWGAQTPVPEPLAPEQVAAVWTFLLGVLVQPPATYSTDWVQQQVTQLLSATTG
ncbi:TetR/AcrR family transcriptional regulator [Levilactobacillus acidifarinae]|uniref:Transcriptional regulator n=1 Tax=Levilactobacillus acidifarinae DSM 19394 = JCM 15949 TaxID=1423715 RepID=A0A0R1LFL0_9LACO|nr:TetR/AcrR family transcriptional regulator [Levilactobacillus acidifarinae]KRK94477.1 transcriptional regulator [Levilactobacillus acidifarinae DSM 19394]GEO68221.1 hypothetical protein LAC03_01310 [Levilactobacillus acidifarinae]